MERIAWINGEICIYWNDVLRLLAVCGALCCFLALYLRKKHLLNAALFVLPALPVSLMLGRLSHWYFRPEQYESLMTALMDLGRGDFALMGAFAGCFLAAVFVRLVGSEDNLPRLLDCLSLAGAFGIGLGRLASFFDLSDRGMVVSANGFWTGLVTDPASGMQQWRLNTFLIQAAVAGLLFLTLLVWYLPEEKKEGWKHGDAMLLFLLLYGASQVVLDSTRYDGLKLRSNGFLSPVQLLSAAAMMVTVLVFAVRLVRAGGWKKEYFLMWAAQAGCFVLTGFLEYDVQRHGDRWMTSYGLMAAALGVLAGVTLATRLLAEREERRHAAWLQQITMEEKEEFGEGKDDCKRQGIYRGETAGQR